jgi:hypothetical protein
VVRKSPKSEEWFPPKRYGYGAGLPFAWQGWVLTIAYMAAVIALGWWARHDAGAAWLAIGGILVATAVFVPIVRRHTRGGWRWRDGGED